MFEPQNRSKFRKIFIICHSRHIIHRGSNILDMLI